MIIGIYCLFFIALLLTSFIPGSLIVEKFLSAESFSKKLVLSWIIGITFFLFSMYLLGYLHINKAYYLIIITTCYLFYQKIVAIEGSVDKKNSKGKKGVNITTLKKHILTYIANVRDTLDKPSLLIVLTGSLIFLSICFFSGWKTSQGLQFISIHQVDSISHLSYIKSQATTFPPIHPALSGVVIHGYHYFYDFLLSQYVTLFHFSAEDLFFRLFPLIISLLYGLGFWLTSSIFTKNKIAIRFVLFLAYFAQTLPSILLLTSSNSNFLIGSQPLGMIFDPSIIFSLAIFLSAFYLLCSSKKDTSKVILASLLIGMLSQIKVYTGILGILMLVIYAGRSILKKQNTYIAIIALIIAGITTAITYFPANWNAGHFVWAPLLFYTHFMESQQIIQNIDWGIQRSIFLQHNNIPHLFVLYGEVILIYWLFNLSIKIVTLYKVKQIFQKSFWNLASFILTASIVFPILITSFFIQSISPFNIVQFVWLSITLMAIPAGICLFNLWRKGRSIKIIIFSLILITTVPGTLFYEKQYILTPISVLTIPSDQLAIYQKASQVVQSNKFIVVIPQQQVPSTQLTWFTSPLVSALTGKTTYYEDESTPYQLDQEFTKRKNIVQTLQSDINICNQEKIHKIFSQINTRYLITANPSKCLNYVSKKYYSTTNLGFYIIDK